MALRTNATPWHHPCFAADKGSVLTSDNPGRLARMRVLVIEDVTDIREVFVMLLRSEGAYVTAVGTGREAAEIVGRSEFDVVLTDLGLPDIPGDVLVRQMSNGTHGRLRIAVITGYGEPYLTRARQAGAEAVFTKPVEWTRVLEYLSRPDLAASA